MAAIRDITERKRVEKMKDNLIRDVSHELKTPLAKMQMSVEQLMETVEAPSIDCQKVARASEIVTGNVQRLQDTVNSILDLSLLESGQIPYHNTKLQPKNLIGQVILDMRPLAEAKGLELVAELPESLPQVKGDRERLLRVLTNLVDNAVKFTDRGKIVISAKKKAHEVEIAVSDPGRGVLGRIWRGYLTGSGKRVPVSLERGWGWLSARPSWKPTAVRSGRRAPREARGLPSGSPCPCCRR
jgi:signal transduction histidine kinase